MQKEKEAASDVAASAKSGMEKTRATVEGQTEKWTTRDPAKKEMAAQKKDERVREAERQKPDQNRNLASGGRTQGDQMGYGAGAELPGTGVRGTGGGRTAGGGGGTGGTGGDKLGYGAGADLPGTGARGTGGGMTGRGSTTDRDRDTGGDQLGYGAGADLPGTGARGTGGGMTGGRGLKDDDDDII